MVYYASLGSVQLTVKYLTFEFCSLAENPKRNVQPSVWDIKWHRKTLGFGRIQSKSGLKNSKNAAKNEPEFLHNYVKDFLVVTASYQDKGVVIKLDQIPFQLL